jgi:probable phosphoglycerate mutase
VSATDRPAGPAELWLVRHGETEWSRDGRHTGRTDLLLDADGRAAAVELRGALAGVDFAVVVSSPLRRAAETAELSGFGDGLRLDDGLREWDYGAYEGRTTADIRAERPGWDLWSDGVPGGETADQVGARADAVLARLAGVEGRALLFAHAHLLRVLAARWVGLPAACGRHLTLDTATVSMLGWYREDRVIRRWNVESGCLRAA